MVVGAKTEVGVLDGTPEKRLFWSIISDYDLRTGLCELIDNAIDLWMLDGRKHPLRIQVLLDADRQLISVTDNAGGVREDNLRLLITPGGSQGDPSAEMIGIFGVGSKRASIALGEQVRIQTRFRKAATYQLEIDKTWLESPSWELPNYEIPNISPGTTQIDISHLRRRFSQQDADEMRTRLGETYSWFIDEGVSIELNGSPVEARTFETWAYPSGYPPRVADFTADLEGAGSIDVKITAGLIRDRDAEGDNYGVYFYCNHRLVVKELRSRDVGYFITSEAGVPHPDASLCRAIVTMQGPAQAMPWNSTKSDINTHHAAFQQLRPILVPLVSHFSSLSRRLKHDWSKKVFRYDTGEMEVIAPGEIEKGRLILPPLPKVNKPKIEKLKTINKAAIKKQPWTLGLVEAMGAVEVIERQKLQTKNRIALIILDSNFEIAMKEFIVHNAELFPPSRYHAAELTRLFRRRDDVIDLLTGTVDIPNDITVKAKHYYALRNKLIHERATVDVTDNDIDTYTHTVEDFLKILFGLKFP